MDLQFLKGRWLRPDGGYVIEIRQVDADGQLDARYFNPSPIRVVAAKAECLDASKCGEDLECRAEIDKHQAWAQGAANGFCWRAQQPKPNPK